MRTMSITKFIMSILVILVVVSSEKNKFSLKSVYQLVGQSVVEEFISSSHVTVVYFYKKDSHQVRFFFTELDKSAEYLELYGVKAAVVDCTNKENAGIKPCEVDKVEENVYTYKFGRFIEEMDLGQFFDKHAIVSNVLLKGNQLLSLELDTMFDVNSIMSNILQLVLLRQVPIVQTPKEVRGLLMKMRGKYDVIFGHVNAIGTFDHRVFMEVAYAYQDRFKFALCTDEQAISAFTDPPTDEAQSNIYLIFAKDVGEDEDFHSIKYRSEVTLQAFAKFLMLLTLPRTYAFPQEGLENPYAKIDAPAVRLYYNSVTKKDISGIATIISNYYWGTLSLTIIDMDEVDSQEQFPFDGPYPALSLQLTPESEPIFMKGSFGTDNIAHFLETTLASKQVKLSEEERTKDFSPPKTPELREEAPYIDHEALDQEDDEVADAVAKDKTPMPLDLVPALTDKTFPTTVQSADLALVYFYIPFDAVNMAFLHKYGQAADRLGKDTKLTIARVNCYDWTEVCGLNNITVYPTLRVFDKGQKSWDYRGPKDTQELYSTFKILELSPPVYVDDSAMAMVYILGNTEIDAKAFTNVVVVGLFSKENKKEIEVFTEVAKATRDRILFVYSDVEGTKKIASQFKTNVPAVIVSKYDDSIQPHVIYNGRFEADSLRTFVQDNKLPKLTTITPLVFPELYKRGSDYLILFTDDSPKCQDQENVMREVLKAGLYNNVSFTLMPVPDDTSVGYRVLKQYTSEPAVPFISYVNLKKGEVFNFEAEVFQKRHLVDWISSVSKRTIQPSSVLKDSEWKPVQKGYDFLQMMDWEKAEARKQEKKRQRNAQEYGTEDGPEYIREELEEHAAEAQTVEEEDMDARRELFELHNSRLYHKNPDRERAHKHTAGKEETSMKQEPAGGKEGTRRTQEGTGKKQEMATEKDEPKHTEL